METVESWSDILGPQALDVALLATFIAIALISFFTKSVRLKYVTLALAVAYMGFFKSHLVSVVDIFGVIDRSLPIAKYNVAYYLLGTFVIASTIMWGRLYCGRMCAFGAMTQLVDAVVPKRWRFEPPPSVERQAAQIKYVLLIAVVVYFVATRDTLVYRYVEPFWMFGLYGTRMMWIGVGILLVATVFVRNLYCRFLCPVGALLGLMSNVTIFKIKRWSECNSCRICEKTCEWGAIRGPKIIEAECVRCDDCERLYFDRKKCPHWIILLKAHPLGRKPAPVDPSTPV